MNKIPLLLLVVMIVVVCMGACSSQNRQFDGIPLPFNEDGSFVMNLPTYNENGRFGSFSFGGIEEWYSRGVIYFVYYIAIDFDSHVAEFAYLMNSITPALVDAITICTVSVEDWLSNPFRSFSRKDFLYFWGRNDFYDQRIGVRMTIYEKNGYGYLHFTLSHWELDESYNRSRFGNTIHHSLYRINSCDLARFSEFADGLARGHQEGHSHLLYTRRMMRSVIVIGTIGLLVAMWGGICIFISRYTAHPLRKFYAKAVFIPIGLLTVGCALIWRLVLIDVLSFIHGESLLWITGICAVIALVLILFASVYVNVSNRFNTSNPESIETD